jgi:hypothetical protein
VVQSMLKKGWVSAISSFTGAELTVARHAASHLTRARSERAIGAEGACALLVLLVGSDDVYVTRW